MCNLKSSYSGPVLCVCAQRDMAPRTKTIPRVLKPSSCEPRQAWRRLNPTVMESFDQ
uniref:Uncharacterized protein n=1 Tax=Anguilla anguilla TaxID=7936 RepID=A0A0E9WD34_ANGAN